MDWTKMFNRKAEASVVQRDDAPNNCCHSVFDVVADWVRLLSLSQVLGVIALVFPMCNLTS